MSSIKNLLKILIPNFLLNWFKGLFYGWKGNYKTWEEAEKKCSGYDSEEIFKKVKNSALKVKNLEAKYERDSVLFYKNDYNYPVFSALMWIAAQNKGNINVLDFGGAFGSTYYQHKILFSKFPNLSWNIIEQEHFVNEGKINFEDKILKFYYTIDDCLKEKTIDVVILSSVIQYIEEPYQLLKNIIEKNIKFILFDRTPFFNKPDQIMIQTVHPSIYKAQYPSWFFNYEKFKNFMSNKYKIILEFTTDDQANIKSEFKGFLFEIKN